MAGLGFLITGMSKLLSRGCEITAKTVRTKTTIAPNPSNASNLPVVPGMNWDKWLDWKMVRDVKRRRCVKEHATMRVRLISMKRNDILPIEIRELAGKALDEMPRTSALRQLTFRCVLTSRPRGVVNRWRLSRIVFRDLADYNKLAGVQEAQW